jgi:UDP-N-acetylglucosamine 2-epimerase (non-hydrolysing)/GDP/UDP-N,N'-diacetylbacillosamine 2-epimerase (hydrolysing)
MSKRKVCVVTGTRAEYGLFYPIIKKIESSQKLQLQLVVTTMHLSSEFGLTYRQIEEDGFIIDEKIENLLCADTKSSVAKSTGMATLLLSDTFRRLEPDIVLLLGDRYETLAAATTALLMNIPIAHIHGGEITEGAVDEQIRHAITKMSYLHFTSTEVYRKRIIQMGEDPTRVFNTGAPGIDNIKNMPLLSKKELENDLIWNFGKRSALFTYHPVTLDNKPAEQQIDEILKQLKNFDFHILFTYSNADDQGSIINRKIEAFCQKNPKKYKVVKNLGQKRYLSAIKYVDLLIGNTSSGIIEAASFHKPVVNIGNRQKGRLQSGNILNCEVDSLKYAIETALTETFQNKCKNVENIYGDGTSSEAIVNVLENVQLSSIKKFNDLKYIEGKEQCE